MAMTTATKMTTMIQRILLLLSLLQLAHAQDAVEAQVENLLSQMTLRDKVGQMIMDAENADELPINIGAYLIGASDPPQGNNPLAWRTRANELNEWSKNAAALDIPVLFGTDAVHGQSIVSGGTIFPHNIGLGATRNVALIKEMARVTALEMQATALDLTFAPTIAVARTMTWGRAYESFSEDTALVSALGAAYIEGLQGTAAGTTGSIATAKHWIGDGGTEGGVDTGDTVMTEDELMAIHGAPYIDAIAQGVGSIMVSFSSFNGVTLHGHTYLIQDVLKGQMGFDGFVMSDWEGYLRNDGEYAQQVQTSVNAGIDMLMCPYQGYVAIESILDGVQTGNIAQSRIDDAARRVLRTKLRAGMFDRPVYDLTNVPPVGTPEHRAVARQAVRESLVLLKNANNILPLAKSSNILIAGKNANNIQNQCGGWTMSWQGTSTEARHQIVGGTTILEGFETLTAGSVVHSVDGSTAAANVNADVAIVVVGETPYAEFEGDTMDLSLDAIDKTAIANVKAAGIPMILVVVSGRPLLITEEIADFDAVVAAWLPGTEGDGVAEVLYGDYPFSGKLPFSWPSTMDDVLPGFIGDSPNVLFEFGYGLDATSVSTPATTTVSTNAPSSSPTTAATEATTTASPTAAETTETTPANTEADTVEETTEPPIDPGTDTPTAGDTEEVTDSVTTPSGGENAPDAPAKPFLLFATSSSVLLGWQPVENGVEYEIFVEGKSAGVLDQADSLQRLSYEITGLDSDTFYLVTVAAIASDGSKSTQSPQLLASTSIFVDDFEGIIASGWGNWKFASGGTEDSGETDVFFDATGYENSNGAQLIYTVDGGSGFANIFLDFDEGEPRDLTEDNVVGVQFRVQGQSGNTMHFHIGTPLADPFNPVFYQSKELELSEEWELVLLLFEKDLNPPATSASRQTMTYTLEEAMQQASAIVFENTNAGQTGWFTIDNVEFITTQSLPQPDEIPDDDAFNQVPGIPWMDDDDGEATDPPGSGAGLTRTLTAVAVAAIAALF